MEMSRTGLRAISLVFIWVLLCAMLLGLTSMVETAEAQPPGTELRVTTNSENQTNPVVYGSYIVYQDDRNIATNGYDIYMYNIATGTETAVCTKSGDQTNPAIYGNTIVWQDARNLGIVGWDVYMYDIPSRSETRLTKNPNDQTNPAIYGTKIVWADNRNQPTADFDIWMNDTATQQESRISSPWAPDIQFPDDYPDIYEDIVVWENFGDFVPEIWMNDTATNQEVPITAAPMHQLKPEIHGNYIVWEDSRLVPTEGWDIYVYSKRGPPDIEYCRPESA
jgi:beta propeller repeat protein